MSKYNWDERHIITFPEEKVVLSTKDLHVYYGTNESIKGVDMQFEKNKITALIGPSGSGKSTYLRSLNRMNDTIDIARVTGEIWYEGIDVNRPDINVYEMRKHIGMVFQRPTPFAKSIYKNITFPHVIVTHSMQQAARASDYTGFFYLGNLIEYDKTSNIFQNAKLQSTNDYVSGHFG